MRCTCVLVQVYSTASAQYMKKLTRSIFLNLLALLIFASEASFLMCSMARVSIYLFHAVRRAVNVLNVFTCIKYLPNAIFRRANINTQHANITGSMNRQNTQPRLSM